MWNTWIALWLFFLAAPFTSQQPSRLLYQPIFHNRYVGVFRLELPPLRQGPIHEPPDDLVWIALDDSTVEVTHLDGAREALHFSNGDVRLFRRWDVRSLTNLTAGPLHSLVVDLRSAGLTSGGCHCTAEVEKSICGCNSAHLPAFWAGVIGDITLAGATLEPKQSFQAETNRDDSLLVTLTPAELEHQFNLGRESEWIPSKPQRQNLQLGEVVWMPEGKHRLTNIGHRKARFVTIEFCPRTSELTSSHQPWATEK
jgi:hypothetical protein